MLGELWSPRFCILNVGEFSFDEVGENGRAIGTPPLSDRMDEMTSQELTTCGSIPLEMASSVRTARRYQNAFVLVLVDGTEYTFRTSDKTRYHLFNFHFN